MTFDEMIAVLQAAKEGKTIQVRGKGFHRWDDLSVNTIPSASFDFSAFEYRIKPTPREFWLRRGYVYYTAREAVDPHENFPGSDIIHVREVLGGE